MEDQQKIYHEENHNLIAWLAPSPPEKFIYTSGTGVYAQNDGSIVTEENLAETDVDLAKVLVEQRENSCWPWWPTTRPQR